MVGKLVSHMNSTIFNAGHDSMPPGDTSLLELGRRFGL
jgi:hypothetical protein